MRAAQDSDDANMHATIITSDAKRRSVTEADLPSALRVQLSSFGRRILPEDMKAFIVALCKWRPMSAEEIASVLGKTTNYVSNKYIYPMVKEGELGHLYPEMVKHPGQKYVAGEKYSGDV